MDVCTWIEPAIGLAHLSRRAAAAPPPLRHRRHAVALMVLGWTLSSLRLPKTLRVYRRCSAMVVSWAFGGHRIPLHQEKDICPGWPNSKDR